MVTDAERVLEQVDKAELVSLALALGNIDSPPHKEKEVADFVMAWLQKEGFQGRILSLLPERPNVVGLFKGTGGGCSLLFNSHMDTAVSPENTFSRRNYMDPAFHSAWRDGEKLYGTGVINDKGPMACFLIATKAIKKAGLTLKGDVLLTAVSGEIAWEPTDEFQSPKAPGHAIGARFIARHGAIADYAICAESTGPTYAWVQAGKLFIKITVFGDSRIYTPFLKGPYTIENSPNAIARMTRFVQKFHDWVAAYEKEHTRVYPGGTVMPRVAIGAIRGGEPFNLDGTSELCYLYIDVRTLPGQNFLTIKAELAEILHSLNLDGEVEILVNEPGYEAKNIEELVKAVEQAHSRVFGEKPVPAVGPYCSMWRDMNVFNEIGVPCLTYGPKTIYGPAAGGSRAEYSMLADDLYRATKVYALVSLDICNRDRKTA